MRGRGTGAHEFDELARAGTEGHEWALEQAVPGRMRQRGRVDVEDQRSVGPDAALGMPGAGRDARTPQRVEPVLPAFDVEQYGAAEGQHELGVGVAVGARVGAMAAHVEVGVGVHGSAV